jgi:hypothetical protein
LFFCLRKHESQPNFEFIHDTRNGFGVFIKLVENGNDSGANRGGENATANAVGVANSIREKAERRKSVAEKNWSGFLAANPIGGDEVRELADVILGVHPDTLRRLEIGYVPETEHGDRHWLFPERDSDGNLIGILRRYPLGDKKRMAGAKSGILFDPHEEYERHDVLLIVEGPSDTAAAWTLGLAAMGRPNNLGGAELLAPLIRKRVSEGVIIVVLGERDQKRSGHWPGREGAIRVATQISEMLGRPVLWSLPPVGFKDLRKWFVETSADPYDRSACEELGRELLKNILAGSKQIGHREARFLPLQPPINTYIETRSNSSPCKNERVSMSPESNAKDKEKRKKSLNLHIWDELPLSVQDVLVASQNTRPCPRHFVPLLQGKSNPRKGLTLRVDCRNHPCAACGPRRRGQWLRHLLLVYELGPKLFAAVVLPDRLDGLRQCLRREQAKNDEAANYVTIQHGAAHSILLIASAAFPGCRCVLPIEAADWTASALLGIDLSTRRPINTSKAWSLYEECADSDYERRGAAPRGRFAEVVKMLKNKKLDPAVSPSAWGARADWVFPGNWCEEQIFWLYEDLSLPPTADEGTT